MVKSIGGKLRKIWQIRSQLTWSASKNYLRTFLFLDRRQILNNSNKKPGVTKWNEKFNGRRRTLCALEEDELGKLFNIGMGVCFTTFYTHNVFQTIPLTPYSQH